MQPKKTIRWLLAAGAAAALGAAFPAHAARDSGGPGALGTSVPFDSSVARRYFNYYLPTDTPEALRIRDGVQKLHADHQAALALARAGAASQSPDVRRFAQHLAERVSIIDGSLVDVANDSLLAISGAAYDQERQAQAAPVKEVEDTPAADRDAKLVAAAAKLLDGARGTVEELRPQARKALRQQLSSVLERDRKVLDDLLGAARGLPGAAPAAG